jgi:hypothetical protein
VNPEEKDRASDTNAQRNEINEVKHLLRQAMPPARQDQLEPRSDLWPQLRARIESQGVTDRTVHTRHEPSSIRIRVAWFDWALAALAAAALLFYPGIVPALLYHF